MLEWFRRTFGSFLLVIGFQPKPPPPVIEAEPAPLPATPEGFTLTVSPTADVVPEVDAAPLEASAPVRKRRVKPAVDDELRDATGKWHFKNGLLDKLDEYGACMAKLRRIDHDAYAMFSRLGAIVVPENAGFYGHYTEPAVLGCGMGAIAFLTTQEDYRRWNLRADDGDELVPLKLVYFRRYDRPPSHVQTAPFGWRVYELAIGYMSDSGDLKGINRSPKNLAAAGKIHVAVSPDGADVHLLRELQGWRQLLPRPKNSHHDRVHYEALAVARYDWSFPRWILDNKWFRRDPHEFASFTFRLATNLYANAANDVRVRVQKGNVVAVFSIDMLRTPYFFADRDVTLNNRGSKRRIFHIVRVHGRKLKDGKETFVRTHFRGERKFSWNGYNINITIPGLHHRLPLEADIGLHEIDSAEAVRDKDYIGVGAASRVIDRHLNV